MSKEMTELQKQRQQGRVRRQAERSMDRADEPSGAADVARRVEKRKAETKQRAKAADEFRRM